VHALVDRKAWDVADQPPEFWNQYKTDFAPGTRSGRAQDAADGGGLETLRREGYM
jgi:hypothetical protein